MKASLIFLLFTVAVFSQTYNDQSAFKIDEPNYLITGFGSSLNPKKGILSQKDNQLKFKLSFNYKLFGYGYGLSGFYIKYAQNTLVNLWGQNPASYNSDMKPEFFTYLDLRTEYDNTPYVPRFRVGLTHETNGLTDDNSRSWNKFTGALEIGENCVSDVFFSLSFWRGFGVNANNRDIRDYAGNGAIKLAYYHHIDGEFAWGTSIDARFKVPDATFKNIEASLYLNPFFGAGSSWAPKVMLQYYWGGAESLRNYTSKTHSMRLGLAFM
ncbi:MAG: phospholipase A [Fibrobacter sp.]|nr:phospholipase A [Fibrobacter sp.]